MANPNAIVSRRVRLEGPPARATEALQAGAGLTVELDDGRRVRLDPADEKAAGYARVLQGLEMLGKPAYLEVDPETSIIRRLLIPTVGRVMRLTDAPGGLELGLDTSHARRLLPQDHDDFAGLARVLRQSLEQRQVVLLTVDDANRVIDARFFEPGPDDGPLPDFPIPPPTRIPEWDFRRFLRWPLWPWVWWWGCVSSLRAQQAFNAMSATSCNPLTVPPPCIPFMYPDDGCWARAHEMCRLMINMGLSPRKVWIQGVLVTPTRNNPACEVRWYWHVAPTLCVRRWWPFWLWGRRTMVIDPALFTTPVTVETWKSVQGDPSAVLTYSDASDYLFGTTDPTYALTNGYLDYYRLQLQLRAINVGPPPYAQCP